MNKHAYSLWRFFPWNYTFPNFCYLSANRIASKVANQNTSFAME